MTYGAAVAAFLLLSETASVPLLYLSILFLGLGIMGVALIGNQVWVDYYGRKQVGSIIGMSHLVRTVALALGPLLAASIHDSIGSYSPAIGLFAILCFAAAFGFIFAKPPGVTEPSRPGCDIPPDPAFTMEDA